MELLRGQFFSSAAVDKHWGALLPEVPPVPAAGEDLAFTLVSGHAFRVVLFGVKVETNAEAASRLLEVRYLDAQGHLRFSALATTAQPASKTWIYTGAIGCGNQSSLEGERQTLELPDFLVPSGWEIQFNLLFKKGGDKLLTPTLTLEQYEIDGDHTIDYLRGMVDELREIKEHVSYGTPKQAR